MLKEADLLNSTVQQECFNTNKMYKTFVAQYCECCITAVK